MCVGISEELGQRKEGGLAKYVHKKFWAGVAYRFLGVAVEILIGRLPQ